MRQCIYCNEIISKRPNIYCSNKCQLDYQYIKYINDWKKGKNNGGRGINAKNISEHLRRYLTSKYDSKCSLCGWNKINTTTGRIPLEVDHIDGDADNNLESNLQLLCPNCHSLTPSFRNLNKGKGRTWRREKYIKTA